LLVDTHCHLNLDQFSDDLDEVILRAGEAGVDKIIVPGVDIRTSEKAIALSQKYPQVYAAVGIHPNYTSNYSQIDGNSLESLLKESKVVAVGEIGLDKYRDFSPLKQQIILLERQLEMAAGASLPVILHSRSAVTELSGILSKWRSELETKYSSPIGYLGVMHAFEGTFEEAQELIRIGFCIGIGGAVTFQPSRIDERILSGLPISNFLLETDSPYLAPLPHRGKRNEPAFLRYTVQNISSKIGISFSELCKITTKTASSIFSIGAAF
jgi:TatD DNase family protein